MSFCEIYKDIVSPMLCSIVGGLFTVGGVYLTIKHEQKKEKIETKISNKPLFYRIDPMQDYDYNGSLDYTINSSSHSNFKIYGIFKNTEKAIMILEYVLVNDKKYFPKYGNVIDKDKIFNLHIYIDEKLKSDDEVILVIKDILDNQYKYRLEIEADYDNNKGLIKCFKEKSSR